MLTKPIISDKINFNCLSSRLIYPKRNRLTRFVELFNNLYLYEIVMLFLGVFLFVLLCAGLVYYIIKKDDIKKLLYFFVIPIVMIGYPSIQEIEIEKDKFALIKYTDRVLEDPDDAEAQKELQRVARNLGNGRFTRTGMDVLASRVVGNHHSLTNF